MKDNISSDFLVTAFEFQLGPPLPLDTRNHPDWEQGESAWSGYDWNFSECGTTSPTPREDHATLFVKYRSGIATNNTDNAVTVTIVRGHSTDDDADQLEDDDDRIRIYRYSPSNSDAENDANDISSKPQFLRGVAYPQEDLPDISNVKEVSSEEEPTPSSSTWTMGIFHVATKEESELACQLAKEAPLHRVALKHEQTIHQVQNLYDVDSPPATNDQEDGGSQAILCITTGMAPTSVSPDSPKFLHQRLSTKIELKTLSSKKTIAKCHMSYRDDQWDPWIGPCIEAMSVNPTYRGHGWLWVLWFQGVVPFLQGNYSIQDDDTNNGASSGIQVRVIHLLGSELDTLGNDNKSTIAMWDKDFYFGQVGFSILPRGLRTGVMNFMRPQDDQGIGYVARTPLINATSPSSICGPSQVGARSCQSCGKITKEGFGCGKCGRVYYCTTDCQATDAPQHTRWCGLTRNQLHEELVKEGRRVQDSKGEWRTVL